MSKQILPTELALIVSGLLIKPSLLGELDSSKKHQSFMQDLACLVGDHCGGEVNGISTESPSECEPYLSNDNTSPMVSISPNDSLPSLNNCVWSSFDPTGWEDEDISFYKSLEKGKIMSESEILTLNNELKNIFNGQKTTAGATVLADFEMQDWNIDEAPNKDKMPYRCIIERSLDTSQVYFKVYPSILDNLSKELAQCGVSGCIEIRNGTPAMNIGSDENEYILSVESNVKDGLFVHSNLPPSNHTWLSPSHNGAAFEGWHYPTNTGWLMAVRSEIANQVFESHSFTNKLEVLDANGWEIKDGFWAKVVFFENPNGGDSIKGHFEIQFAPESLYIKYLSES